MFRRRKREVEIIVIDVLLDLEEHQKETPEREIVGRIVVKDKVAVRYDPFWNWHESDRMFYVSPDDRKLDKNLGKGEFGFLVHSHPGDDVTPAPTTTDLVSANRRWLKRPYGIFVSETGQLHLWFLKNRKTYERIPYKTALGPKAFAQAMEQMSKPKTGAPKFPQFDRLPPLDKSL